jgi:5'-methylthioinosine phosphorylase
MNKIAIIGGTGFSQLDQFRINKRTVVETPYGEPSDVVVSGVLSGQNFLFLPRHGSTHLIPPHLVNYRANLWALQQQGADRVIGIAAVGAIDATLGAGSIAIPDQIVDYTWGREHTFSDASGCEVQHIDFTNPYSAKLRLRLIKAAQHAGVTVAETCTYAATQGPRLETAAEIDRLEIDGADIVGMTGMPEAALARELSLDYACIAIVVNAAAGRGAEPISMDAIREVLATGSRQVLKILEHL